MADDQALVRAVITDLVASQPDMELVAEAEGGIQAVELALSLVPDVVVLDLTMPDLEGTEALRKILQIEPGIQVLVLTMHDDMAHLLPVLKAGAAGYVTKAAEDEKILTAIRAVASGKSYIQVPVPGAPKDPPKS